MNRTEAIAWVLSVCANYLRLSRAKTLSVLVAAAMGLERFSISNLGRAIRSPATVKALIKRAHRFIVNPDVLVADAMAGPIDRLLRRKARSRKPVLIALDWTQVHDLHILAACAVIRGRSVPLLWASYREWDFHHSQNDLEEGLLRLLRTLLPEGVGVILLADRGFGRTELARVCQELGLGYIIRISPDVWVDGKAYVGKLIDYPLAKGQTTLLRNVAYRKRDPVRQNVAILWKRDLPEHRDEPWFLMTDRAHKPARLAQLYGRRMTIEECFRDHKSKRNGFALRLIQVKTPQRLDRVLLILALAYLLLAGIGLVAKARYGPGMWCNSTDPQQCSVFTIGRILLDRLRISPATAIAAVRKNINAAT